MLNFNPPYNPAEEANPAARFQLWAFLPRTEYASARLGRAILGAFLLPAPKITREATILGMSYLGASRLSSVSPFFGWQNITAPVTEISYSRGVNYDGLTSKADTGTLEATIYNSLDPRASSLYMGVPIILYDAAARVRLYTGTIKKLATQPSKTGSYTVSFQAVDLLSELSSITKYQETSPMPTRWETICRKLLQDYPLHVDNSGTDGAQPLIGSLVKESSLAEYIDIYCNTAGASWYIGKDNQIYLTTARFSFPPTLSISDTDDYSPVELDAAFDTSQIISVLEISNNDAEKNEEGEWQSTTTSAKVVNSTLRESYGENTANIETAGANIDAVRDFYKQKLADATAEQVVKSATFTLIADGRALTDIEDFSNLEILDTIAAEYRNAKSLLRIGRISGNISPLNASITLDFIY